jgi:hypothetical protein
MIRERQWLKKGAAPVSCAGHQNRLRDFAALVRARPSEGGMSTTSKWRHGGRRLHHRRHRYVLASTLSLEQAV